MSKSSHMGLMTKKNKKSLVTKKGRKKDPTNRIRTSDLRKSIYNYSPPLYQLSYGRYPKIRGKKGSLLNSEVIAGQKNSIAGNRTRGTNVKGLYVTNYTTMDINSKKKKG